MLKKRYIFIRISLIFLLLISLVGCNSYPEPKSQSDYTEVSLDHEVDSIKSGLPYAYQRAMDWRNTMYLMYINAGFIGKDQVSNRIGEISYYFYEDDVTKKLDAYAYVCIDMNNNSIIRFTSTYGTKKQLGGGSEVLNTDNWMIDIDDAFDIAIAELGEDSIFQYDNPKVVLRCGESSWDFAVYSSSDTPYPDLLVEINPENGEVLEVKFNQGASN